ncbi:MAG: carboxypeptidase regulatory-like domain-containing protein [Aquisalinus sp.]|nr:carboxypeptidase regulatory-like domain-containing protein [Aquisalinus sp.]
MKLTKALAAGAAAIALTAAWGGTAMAQTTTSSVRGVVTDESGSPLANSTVTITDTRTGVSRTVTTNSNGQFSSRNLPVGGPYTVSAANGGFQGERVEGLFLTVGEAASLTFDLEGSTTDEIIVVGTPSVLADIATGPAAVFTQQDIIDLPTTNRDIKDIIRIDPRVFIDETNNDGIECVGFSNRINSLTVDGVVQNDNFGLNSNGFPTQRLPFPFDIVEQISVELAPFDVEYGNFSGCNINIVSKSGGNEFSGKFFVDYTNGDLQGDSIEGDDLDIADFDEYSYGGVLTGPIIQDKLFFTLGYEKFEGEDINNIDPDDLAALSSELQQAASIAQSVYGYDAGGLPGTAFDVEDERFFGKLDWYINEQNRLEVQYQRTEGNNVIPQNTGGGDIALTSNYYNRTEELDVYTARLFSEWTPAFSTEARISYQERTTGQDPIGGTEFAQVVIDTASGDEITLGPDVFRHANMLEQEQLNIKLKGDYQWNDHLFTAGYEYDNIEIFNLFVAFSQGEASYDSLADFQNQTPSSIFYANYFTNDPADGAASFDNTIHTLYAQDTYTGIPDVTLTAGLRIDMYSTDDTPTSNPRVQQRYGIPNDQNFDGKSIIQPRIAFDWQVDDRTTLFGGFGIFSGGNPFVFLSNSYSNTGFLGSTFETDPSIINGFNGFDIPTQMQADVAASGSIGDGFVNFIDPNFEIPQVRRWALGGTYNADFSDWGMGDDWLFGVDFLYSETEDPFLFQQANLVVVGRAPDGRPIYAAQDLLDPDCPEVLNAGTFSGNCSSRSGGSGDGDFFLTNSNQTPDAFTFSTYVNKDWDFEKLDIDMTLGYAYTDAEEVSPLTSSRAISNFENFSTSDFNNPVPATANSEVEQRFTARVTFDYEWKPEWNTRFTFFGQLNEGRPFSYTFDTPFGDGNPLSGGNLFGDSDASEDRSLVYVPTGVNDPLISPLSDRGALQDYLNFIEASGLGEYRGGIAPRNAFQSDWNGKIDLRIQQNIPLPKKFGDDKLKFIVDIDNFTNLLNDEWGIYRQNTFEFNVPIVDADIDYANNQYIINSFNAPRAQSRNIGISTWEIQLGARYEF